MDFKLIPIKKEYRSFSDEIVNTFYTPLLKNATLYRRAVGFFSSSALIEISYGIVEMLKNGGHIQLIASPRLQKDDIDAIAKGYLERNTVIERVIMESFTEPKNYIENQRLNLLATLVAQGHLDIKIAFIDDESSFGIYHEKVGLINDNHGNVVAFTGSMNETGAAFSHNYETIDVFCSWKEDSERVSTKEASFETLWNNSEPKMRVIDFPSVAREKLQSYRQEDLNMQIDSEEFSKQSITIKSPIIPFVPKDITFHDYQLAAIDEWERQDYQGIFDMATGTGKTYTGLGAIIRLSNRVENHLAVIVVCPYQHLVEQWVEDIEKFKMTPIIGYSGSSQKDWKQKLENAVRDHKLKVKNREFFCFICTNATFASDFVQSQIKKMKGNMLLIVDEAHNFGATRLSSMLSDRFNFRLALSATLERHNDEEGTEKLKNYFGSKCIEYSLERAIQEKKLTPYKYYPVLINLNENELQNYNYLSQELNKCIIKDKSGKSRLSEKGKKIALKRARLVAAAKSKIEQLREVIQPYTGQSYLLVYCGAASLLGDNDDFTPVDEEELRQIDAVTNMLGNDLKMKVSQFTSKEDVEERHILKQEFERGDNLQALIAIKCLDEGVNIPKIKVAFILASTTNPKEYIQRRGRVLRLSSGKDYAEIYDFITTPRPLNEVSSLTVEEMKKDLSLIRNELNRAEEFARIAMNAMEADVVIQAIKEAYNINEGNLDFGNE